MSEKEKEVKVKFSTLYILPKALKRVMYYAQAAEGEVSGLGTIKKDEKGRYIVDDVFLLDQESSGADTELNPESISKLMTDMMKKNEDPSRLKFWWHSHANMGVFWSGTDDTCAETLSREFAFSLVVNKSGEKLCRLDIYNPIRITFNHIKLEEIVEEDKELQELCEKEVKEKVKTPSYNYNHGCGGYGARGATGGRVYPNHNHRDLYDDMYGGYGHHYLDDFDKKKESRVLLGEEIVKDIERFIDISSKNEQSGGAFGANSWTEYAFETLKELLEKRYESRASCKAFATWDEEYTACKKECRAKKSCQYWTNFLAKKQEELDVELNGAVETTVESVEEEASSLDSNSTID